MLRNIAPRGTARSVRRARRLRRELLLPEVLLCQQLRRAPAGLKFRRQHATGPFDLDFYCSDARLALEVDGEAHNRGDRPARDAARDRWILDKGIATMRISAIEVLRNLDGVLQGILAEAIGRLPPQHPSRNSSPSLLGAGDQPQAGGGACPSAPSEASAQVCDAEPQPSPPPPPGGGGPPPRGELGEEYRCR